MLDTAYDHPHGALAHHYGPNVHILSDPWGLTVSARLGDPETPFPEFHHLLRAAFRRLLHAATSKLPTRHDVRPTRMTEVEPRALLRGTFLDPEAPAVVVDIARAGMVPSHEVQLALMDVLRPSSVRVDHVYLSRVSDPSTGHVTGVSFFGSKVGGPVAGATVFVPDPMGATGSSVSHVLDHYTRAEGGPPAKLITLHLIVTPEYLRRITSSFPNVHVYALRLDRGMSPPDVLEAPPGARWDEERGLNAHDYIVPGAGGLGEVINNAWV